MKAEHIHQNTCNTTTQENTDTSNFSLTSSFVFEMLSKHDMAIST